jgi:mono/diheme cytochrome c family protein
MKSVITVLGIGIAVSLTIGTRAAAAQAADDGATLYRQHCRTCHGAAGTPTARMVGLYPKLKTLSDSALMAGLSVEAIVNVIKKGQGDMKPLGDKLTADQMTAVAQFVKTLPSAAHKP